MPALPRSLLRGSRYHDLIPSSIFNVKRVWQIVVQPLYCLFYRRYRNTDDRHKRYDLDYLINCNLFISIHAFIKNTTVYKDKRFLLESCQIHYTNLSLVLLTL